MNIALVDDLPRELSRLSGIISEYLADNHLPAEIQTFESGEAFLEDFRPLKYTIVFMDIYMNGMSGVEAAKKIRETDNDTFIVFLTTSHDHAFDAFDVHAYQYILKSPDDSSLKASILRVLNDISALRSGTVDMLSFSMDGAEQSVPFESIVYAQSQKNYIQIVDRSGRLYRTRMTFSDLTDSLVKDKRFLQINRGIVVNMDFITSFEKENCELTGGYTFPINVRESKALDQIRQNYVFSKLHSRRFTKGK
ncbi:MAG: LytTR family DNA-binding domain-containing protein [Lachnospiraceae bacterium]|nr:LytTR family DNA-binding domain-containing protein [Lachnospiraceae bacterium]